VAATVYSNDGTELSIGGRVEFRGDFIGSSGKEVEGTMNDKSRARINVKGSSEISNNLSAFGVYEAELENKEDITNRYFYTGLKTEVG
ncbi:porin, partial [Vibrio campbellii]